MSASSFDRAKLENLAERIYQGQVVFFIGAGFSLDSEGLSAFRLMLRLLARFDAFSWVLARIAIPESRALQDAAARASELRGVLRDTFELGTSCARSCCRMPGGILNRALKQSIVIWTLPVRFSCPRRLSVCGSGVT